MMETLSKKIDFVLFFSVKMPIRMGIHFLKICRERTMKDSERFLMYASREKFGIDFKMRDMKFLSRQMIVTKMDLNRWKSDSTISLRLKIRLKKSGNKLVKMD